MLGVQGTAYVPIPSAPIMAAAGKEMAYLICILMSFFLSLAITLLANHMERQKQKGAQ